jgi:PRC-barrel domain
MLKDAKELKGLKLHAHDGEFGKIKDLYFDDTTWVVRYLVADTGSWLPGRKVLISPFAVQKIRSDGHGVEVSLSKKQIEESPSIEMDMPVSRQFEMEYYEYYNWPVYWSGPLSWGPIPCPDGLSPGAVPVPPPSSTQTHHGDPHLRSVNDVSGYAIQALDEHFGHIAGFIIDEQDWAIRYLVADTRNWLPGKKVLIPAQWISSVSWPESRVYVDLDMETVKRGPEYNSSEPITRDYENRLFAHYGRTPYWADAAPAAKAA